MNASPREEDREIRLVAEKSITDDLLVTGGAGFIGANFVRWALAHRGGRVVVLDKLTYAGHRENLEDLRDEERLVFVQGDIADREQVEDLLVRHRPGAVVNFAAETHVDRSIDDPWPFVHTNLVGVAVLLEAARRYHGSLDISGRAGFRFLHVSTDEVYGSLGDGGLFSETTPYAPNSPYSASKAGADHLVRAYHVTYRLPTLITNCSNNYGPYQYPEKLIPLALLNALEGRPIPVYGDGANIRDWLHVEDHCEALLRVLRQGMPGEKYNIGAANERTNLQVIDQLCAALDRWSPPARNPALVRRGIRSYAELKTFVPDRPGHDRRYAIDGAKIRAQLGWIPRYSFEAGMEATVGWYFEHLSWCAAVQAGGYQRQRLGLPEAHFPVGP
jgi:dTDP-glucose 4,6-dehydratase